MWIKTQSGALVNSAQVSSIGVGASKKAIYAYFQEESGRMLGEYDTEAATELRLTILYELLCAAAGGIDMRKTDASP
jgi:hypothetical protein